MDSSLEVLSQRPSAQIQVESDLFASLSIWIETTEVPNYPRLFRRLKTNGASVVHYAKDAKFIIVNSSSTEGQKVVRLWANDTSKICLDFAWIQQSIDAGKPLLESDNWGECRQFDDGQSVLDDETEEYQRAIPPLFTVAQLPTPRQTPTMSTSVPSNTSSPTFQCETQLSSLPTQPTASSSTVATPVAQLIPPSFFSQLTSSPSPFVPPSGLVVPFGQPFSPPTASDLFFFQQQFNAQLQQQYQHPVSTQTQPLSQSPYLNFSQVCQELLQQAASVQQRIVPPVQQEASLFGTPRLLKQQTAQQASTQPPLVQNIAHTVSSPLPGSTSNPLRSCEDSPIVITTKPDLPAGSGSVLDRTERAIFEVRIGVPLKFLVQIDLKNRAQVTKAIKRHGGKIISAVSDADFAILSSRGSDYGSLRSEADFNNVPVLTTSFVIDCEEKQRFLSTSEYTTAPAETAPSRGRKRKATTTEPKSTKSKPYTSDEREDFTKYVRRLIKRTPDIKAKALAPLLYKKMPSHTLKSWAWFCSQNKSLIEDIRMKVEHDHASKDEDDVKPIQIDSSSDRPISSLSSPLLDAVRSKPEPHQDILPTNEDIAGAEQDFDFVREFFASGAGDSGLEDEVWLTMTNQKKCKTAKSWQEFCNRNYRRIVSEQIHNSANTT